MDAAGARAIVDASSYLTLATADAGGTPWASPVWFAHHRYETFLWLSQPGARHSRNIAARRELAIVLFNSTVSPDQRNAVCIEATADIVHRRCTCSRSSATAASRCRSRPDHVLEPPS